MSSTGTSGSTRGTSREDHRRSPADEDGWREWFSGVGAWRPAIWLVLAAASALPPQPSVLLPVLLLAAGAAAIVGVRLTDTRWQIALLLGTASLGLVGSWFVPGNGLGVVPIFVAAGLIGRVVPAYRVVAVLAGVLAVAAAVALFWVSRTGWASLGALGVPAIALRTWDRAALRREHTRVLELLDELEARRDAEVHAAAVSERARIARDLHDVLAHTLSGLSLHLQAIRAVLAGRADIPETVISSVDRAADLARTGLDEARHAVAALREDTARAPGSGELTALVAGHDGAELAVDGDFDTLTPAARETAFATVRESLTNAERHAPGAHVHVTVATGDGVLVRVSDDGAAAPVTAGHDGGGHGLTGLAERATAAGGTLDARPEPPGWTVELRLPGTPPDPARPSDPDDEGAR